MTAHRWNGTHKPMTRYAPMAPMSDHDEWLAGIRPTPRPMLRFVGGVVVLIGLAVVGTLLCVVMP